MSFLLDPPLLVAAGAVTQRVAGEDGRARLVRRVTVSAFIAVSAALYANVEPLARAWPTLGARSGREFMLTSGLGRVDDSELSAGQHLAALSLFALYPLWFELGRAAARG